MTIRFESERFKMRDIDMSDAKDIFELDSNPQVHEFLGNTPINSLDQAKASIAHIEAQYVKNKLGRSAIIDKNTNKFVGWSGLKFEEGLREFSYYDLGYRLKKEYWGQGIATETAMASLKYGFEDLKLDEIGGAADVRHIVSNTILKKIGLKFVDTFMYDGVEHNWYNLKMEDWLKSAGKYT